MPTNLPPTTAEERARWKELCEKREMATFSGLVATFDALPRLLDDIERLEAVAEAAKRLVDGANRGDEVGKLARGLAALRQALRDCDRCKE